MAAFILDASAALAALLREEGTGRVIDALQAGAAMSTVNVAEVAARLYELRWEDTDVGAAVDALSVQVLPFDFKTALLSARFRVATRSLGLGLGDRACLAAASLAKCPAVTADRIWGRIDLPSVEVHCIR